VSFVSKIKNVVKVWNELYKVGNQNLESEIILGKALKQHHIPRSQVVIATKCFFQVYDDVKMNSFSRKDEPPTPQTVNQHGNSRKHIFDAVEASLKRLDTDYIDLYQQ